MKKNGKDKLHLHGITTMEIIINMKTFITKLILVVGLLSFFSVNAEDLNSINKSLWENRNNLEDESTLIKIMKDYKKGDLIYFTEQNIDQLPYICDFKLPIYRSGSGGEYDAISGDIICFYIGEVRLFK